MQPIDQFQRVLELADSYNLIPIVRHVMGDTETPIRVFHHFYEEDYAFLLESVEGGANWARYSFIGTDPFLQVQAKKGSIQVIQNGDKVSLGGKPIEALKALLSSYRSPDLPDMPRFTGGAVGFFGYDLLQYYENLPAHRIDDLQMNDMQFMFCDQVIVFDHLKQQLQVIANVPFPPMPKRA